MKFIPWNPEQMEELLALWAKELSVDFPMREELFIAKQF